MSAAGIDAFDFFERGASIEDFQRLAAEAPKWNPPPAPNLEALLGDLATFVRRFVILSPAQADVVVLWTAHAHALDAFDTTPFLSVSSAEKRSGKTRLLEVLELLVPRPWRVVSPSEAVLCRKVDADKPTLTPGRPEDVCL